MVLEEATLNMGKQSGLEVTVSISAAVVMLTAKEKSLPSNSKQELDIESYR